MKNTQIKFCNETIYPGETLSMALPLPSLFSCAPLYMPIKIIHGKNAGPTLLIFAAMHGNEINGTDIINRLIHLPGIKKLAGTLITIPVVNVYGLINRSRHLPDNTDLDSCFPGSEHGSNAARLANIITKDIFSKADYCIDLQTGPLNYSNLPQLYINFNNSTSKELATEFNTPVILNTNSKPGSLRSIADQHGTPYLMYEAGEAMRFDNSTIKTGLTGILNVMRKLQMLPEKHSTRNKGAKSFFAEKCTWVHSPASGISYTQCKLGQHIKKGDKIAVIKDPFGMNNNSYICSSYEGIIIGINNQPLVHEGEGILQLAVFQEMGETASHLETWHEINEQQSQ